MTATRKDLAGLELAKRAFPDNAWAPIAQTKAAPAEDGQGEAVEVVGTRYSRITENGRNVSLVRLSRSRRYVGWHAEDLMTVAQHNRIMAAAKPDAELVELLRDVQICRNLTSYPLKLGFAKTRDLDGVEGVHAWMAEVHSRIDAKLKEYK